MKKIALGLILVLFLCSNAFAKCLQGNCKNGYGIATMTGSGDKYIGDWKNGNRHGQGTYIWTNGNRYIGEFNYNIRSGQGIMLFASGAKYEGEFKNGTMDGQGTYIWPNGDIYVGEFKYDKPNGLGILTRVNGEKYEGEFVNNNFTKHSTVFKKPNSSSSSSASSAIEHGLNTLSGNTNSGYGTTRLYYDNSSGGMRECSYEPLNGRCFTFKPFNRNSYLRDTLFYNPKEKTMQPCIGAVTALGKCTAFGLFRKTPNSTSQLFYDEENNKMTTCSHVGVDGKCYYFDLSPKKEYRGFQSQSKTNPYYFKAPETSSDLIEQGLNMLGGGCTLGRNC